jgi:hypothetical protein
MKRSVIALVLMAAAVGACIMSIMVLTDIKNNFMEEFSLLEEIAESGDKEKAANESKRIAERWIEEHHVLCRIVRHTQLDQVTLAVARFEFLARYGETAELTAEINRCRILLEDIWDSELPLIRNIM